MILKSIQLERNNKMGLTVFRISKASYDVDSKYEPIIPQNNPNPLNYEIIKTFERITGRRTNYLLVDIKYPDCTNYEGRKILLYENVSLCQLKLQKQIDPHFCESVDYFSPIARFAPTKEGWEMAIFLIEQKLKQKEIV